MVINNSLFVERKHGVWRPAKSIANLSQLFILHFPFLPSRVIIKALLFSYPPWAYETESNGTGRIIQICECCEIERLKCDWAVGEQKTTINFSKIFDLAHFQPFNATNIQENFLWYMTKQKTGCLTPIWFLLYKKKIFCCIFPQLH